MQIFIQWYGKISQLLFGGKLRLMAIDIFGYTAGTIITSAVINAGCPPLYAAALETGGGALLPFLILCATQRRSPLTAAFHHFWAFVALFVASLGMNALYGVCLEYTRSATVFTGTSLSALLFTSAIADVALLFKHGNQEESAAHRRIVRWTLLSVLMPLLAGAVFGYDVFRRQGAWSLTYTLGLAAGASVGVFWGGRIIITGIIGDDDRRQGRNDADLVKLFASLLAGSALLGGSIWSEHPFTMPLPGTIILLFSLYTAGAGVLTTALPQLVETRAIQTLEMKPSTVALVQCLLPAAAMVGTWQVLDIGSDLLMVGIVALCVVGVYAGTKSAKTPDR